MGSKMKRRLTNKEMNDLYKIENLLNNPPKPPKVLEERTPKKKEQFLEVNNKKININSIKLSDHAIKRSIERLKLKHTKDAEVTAYIRKQLLQSEYIGKITATDGTESEMFLVGTISIQLEPNLTVVKTILKYDKLPYNPLSDKIKGIIHKEFRKLDRSERAKIKQLELHRYECEAEIAELKLRIYKTKSESVKFASQGRIAALNMRLLECENEIEQIKTDKRQVAYALATVYG
ncbi:hypothetical protein [Niallia taxi]|uniref:hypothetical protein n=1 Tax=Niallia taxi TaxID=2499688 RepID=UPI00300AC2F2